MAAPQFTLLRINTSGDVPVDFVNVDAPDHSLYEHLREVGHWEGEVSVQNYAFYDAQGKRKKYEVYFAGNGLGEEQQPNHRANAMAIAGMYHKNGTPDENCRQMQLKQEWGCRFFVGDIIIRIKKNQTLPDLTIFGDNPLSYIMSFRAPQFREEPTPQYKRKFPDWEDRCNPHKKKTQMPSGRVSLQMFEDRGYEEGNYSFFCPSGSYCTEEFKDTLNEWAREAAYPPLGWTISAEGIVPLGEQKIFNLLDGRNMTDL